MEPMPADKRRGGKYCCIACASTAGRSRATARAAAKSCARCGQPFQPDKPQRRFCGTHCTIEAKKKRQDINCAYCGKAFHPKSYVARFCSQSCAARNAHATGRLRHFPRKLTAKRFDRLIERMRPKRRYVQRLTAERFDRLLAKVSRSG